jgi:hypothetical protein
MNDAVERLAAEIDAVTDALETATSHTALARLLRRRELLIAKLTEQTPADRTLDSLRRALESGRCLEARLTEERSLQRAQLGRLYHAKVLLEALRTPSAPERINYQG